MSIVPIPARHLMRIRQGGNDRLPSGNSSLAPPEFHERTIARLVQRSLTTDHHGGDNDGMTSPKTTTPNGGKPFQFGLGSIFLATAAVGVALALLKLYVLLIIPIIHVLAGGLLIVLTNRKAAGGYVAGLVLGGALFGLAFSGSGPTVLTTTGMAVLFVSTVTLAGWLVGAIGAMIQDYPGLGWSFLFCGGIWIWVLAFLAVSNLASI